MEPSQSSHLKDANIQLLAPSPGGIVRSESGPVPTPAESAVWKGGVCDASARCGLSQPCPDHRPPEEHHRCARARIPYDPAFDRVQTGLRQTASGSVTDSTTRRRSPSATGTSSGWLRRRPPPTRPTAWRRGNAGPPGTSPPPDRARAQAAPPMARHRPGRHRHRAWHRQDRQGSRRIPDPPGCARMPGGQSCLLAAKRYRDPEHRLFHRDAGYLEGRRTRDSRVSRAAANRTAFGRQAIAGMWANAEFAALCLLCEAGVPVPYPVQITGTEVLLEFIGDDDGTAAPRLAETRPDEGELADLWDQLVDGPGRARPARVRARRPVAVQPAGPLRHPGDDRPAAGG